MRDMVLVLNFDDTASRAVTRKLRSERIMCKIVPGNIPLGDVLSQEPLGLVLAGGSVGQVPGGMDAGIPASGTPVLALGDAAAMLLEALGGRAGDLTLRNAVTGVSYDSASPLLREIENGERLLPAARSFSLPGSVKPLAFAQDMIVGYAHESLPVYGMQLQIEQNDPEGGAMLRNFALNICGCTAWWDDDAFVARAVEEISRAVGEGRAVCAMTGGLDSGVSALLAFKALGRQLKCIFVDTGLLREREGDDFIAFYRDTIGMDITRVNAQERFMEALRGVEDPDEKRAAIRRLLQRILREEEEKLAPIDALIRGTSYNDIMFGNGPMAPALGDSVRVIEPVRELFKDEIRRVGDFMGIPADQLSRQPFPGSGLALRIVGEVTRERLNTLRAADAIFRAEVLRSNAAKKLWQYFAVLLPLPGEGEQAVICLRAVQSNERGVGYAARLPYDVMEMAADGIQKELKNVRRVVYDLTPSSHYQGVEWQ